MARAGRELERLVGILEELMRPAGLLVRSPDHVRDTLTGQLREVDVSVRASAEGTVIAICECRDRASAEDVTWIEQVVTKAHDLEGSPPAVLVSSSGFSEAAREKARSYGHDVRLVTEVTLEEFRSWFQVEHFVVEETQRGLAGCDIELTGQEEAVFASAVSKALEKDGLNAAIFKRARLASVSANQIFEEWYEKIHDQIQRDVPIDGETYRRAVPVRFSDPEACFSVDTETGPRPVAGVRLQVAITRTKRLVPASRVTRYSDEGGELAESVEFDLDSDLGTVSLHKMSEGPIHVRHRPEER